MTAVEPPARQLFVVVERVPVRLRMRLAPVRHHGERLAVVNQGVGITPLERLGDGDPGSLSEVYHIFRRLQLPHSSTGDEDRLASAFSAWGEVLARSGIDLRLERRALYGPPLPRPDWAAQARGISLRPWDVELTAIEAGLRAIVKLDRIPLELIEPLRRTAELRGLRVEVVASEQANGDPADAPRSVTLLVARDASALAEARGLEQLLLLNGGSSQTAPAVSSMGELLGYPSCCVERFARIVGQNDTTLAWALLPGLSHPPASPLTQWLQPGLALLSHSPCDLHCAASVALGQRLLEVLDARERGFADRWRSLAARVQVVDQRGNRIALAVDGRLESGGGVTAADVLASGGPDPDATARAQRLVGRQVRPDSGGLVVAGGGDWYAPYAADHRGWP